MVVFVGMFHLCVACGLVFVVAFVWVICVCILVWWASWWVFCWYYHAGLCFGVVMLFALCIVLGWYIVVAFAIARYSVSFYLQ